MVSEAKKPVMLYFSNAHVDPNALDTKQWEALKAFKAELSDKGLFWQYESVPELKQLLNGQLTIIVREINVGTSVDSRAVKRAIATAENVDTAASPRPARSDDDSIDEDGPYLEFYSEKSFVIRGNSLVHKDALKELKGGSWIKPRTGARTWCFSNKRLADVAKILGIKPEIRPASQ